MTSFWLTLDVERVLYVDYGRDVILCDRNIVGPKGGTLVIKVTGEAIKRAMSERPREGT